MKNISTTLLLSVLLVFAQGSFAANQNNGSAASFDNAVKEYNFEDNSYNISDEQLQKGVEGDILEADKKVSFWSKVINSSHFSSNTATRTWIPVKKDVEP